MKLYVRSSEDRIKSEDYIIDVVYEVSLDDEILASYSEIKPVYLKDGAIDEQALADYNAFIDTIYGCLCSRFDVVDIEESPKSKTSWYFWLYGKDEDGNVATKFIVRLRISDHEYAKHHNSRAEQKYVDNKAQDLKRAAMKKHQNWILKNIVVNGRNYFDYEDAEFDIFEKMDRLSDKLNREG